MFNSEFFDDVARKLSSTLPSAMSGLRSDVEKTFKNVLQQTFNKLDLVTREEFDVQAEVLAQTRMKLEKLLQQVENIEKRQQA